MLHKVGCEVIYRDGAFKTPSDHKRSQLWNPLPEQLLGALELAKKVVLDQSQAEWIVVIKSCIKTGFRTDDIMAKVVMYVPAGTDQRASLLEALESFEDVLAERLGYPVNTEFRSLENDEPKCLILACGKKPNWVRHTQPGRDDYFCASHAQSAYDFFSPTRLLIWEELEPATT